MKKCMKILSCMLCIALVLATLIVPASAARVQRWSTHTYSDLAHGSCNYVRLSAIGDTTTHKVESQWFDSSYTHWPNGVTFGNTWRGYGYAKGTYTMYSSLVTQWASIAFSSKTDTITINF